MKSMIRVFSSCQRGQDPKPCEHRYSEEFAQSVTEQCAVEFIPKEVGFFKYRDGNSDPFSIHIFHPPSFLGFWAALRETVLVEGAMTRVEKEILASFVSKLNGCVFCTDAHILAAKSQGGELPKFEEAVSMKDPSMLPNKKLGKTIEWALAAQTRGVPGAAGMPPNASKAMTEIIGATFVLNYINRVVDIFVTRDSLLPSIPLVTRFFMQRSKLLMESMKKKVQEQGFGAYKGSHSPGYSISLMDHCPDLPKDFQWAENDHMISRAFAYWSWAVQEMASLYIPENLQTFVRKYISENYNGADIRLSREWAFGVSKALLGTGKEQFAAGFMILAAFSRFEIDKSMMSTLRKYYPSYGTRRAFGIFASFHCARTIAHWQDRKCRLEQ